MTLLQFIAGLVLLIAGAELLVRGASRLAAAIGIAPLVIGLTVVAWGTSAPEVAVSLQASLGGRADLAVGNAVGSNILNVLLILGASAALAPVVVSRQLVRVEVPLMVGVALALWALAADHAISRAEGGALLSAMAAYTWLQVAMARREARRAAGSAAAAGAPPAGRRGAGWLANAALVAVGLVLLVAGARWLLAAAVVFARNLGVGELVIGLTIVALGTSLPEVATSIVASARGERDIAVGNVVGSCIFNVLMVLGSAAAISPGGLAIASGVLEFDLPVMVATAVACLPILFTGHRIARWEGFLFLGYYAAYTAYLVLASTRHAALPAFSTAMTWFVLPLTAVTLAVTVARSLRQPRPAA